MRGRNGKTVMCRRTLRQQIIKNKELTKHYGKRPDEGQTYESSETET